MELSRISVSNFRNFAALDVELAGSVVVVGENRVGKSNLLHALRLLFDPALPDSARQLTFSDFWDGLTVPGADNKVTIARGIILVEGEIRCCSSPGRTTATRATAGASSAPSSRARPARSSWRS